MSKRRRGPRKSKRERRLRRAKREHARKLEDLSQRTALEMQLRAHVSGEANPTNNLAPKTAPLTLEDDPRLHHKLARLALLEETAQRETLQRAMREMTPEDREVMVELERRRSA